MWGDLVGLQAIVRASKSLIYSERLGYSPTTATPMRIPDMAFIDKSRTIYDIRRINLGLAPIELFPIWLPQIKHIAEKPFDWQFSSREYH